MADLGTKKIKFSRPLSILDLVVVNDVGTPGESMKNSLDLARNAEKWGYERYWLAEHHNIKGIASSATSVLIGFIAGGTTCIRVGSGGVMLPNHSPLIVAEQFGTLESLYPGRLDLGIGRAPGTDRITSAALRRIDDEHLDSSAERFPNDVKELLGYFKEAVLGSVRAIPGEGLPIPVWLLGSSTYSANLAAELGLPFAFASHFAPAYLDSAIRTYHLNFQPSKFLQKPYLLTSVNIVVADTDAEAKRHYTSMQMKALSMIRRRPDLLKPPVETMDNIWDEYEKYAVNERLKYSFIGSPIEVRKQIDNFLQNRLINEIMAVTYIYDHKARLRSYELLALL